MGRSQKTILTGENTDRRETGYYSTPEFVADFVADRLFELNPNLKSVFDPCIGAGEFTAPFKKRGCHVFGIDVIDMSPLACDEFMQGDFLEESAKIAMDLRIKRSGSRLDAIVMNPPYNCHEVDYIRKNKNALVSRYGKAATLNMYALFMRAAIEYAPEGCLIGLLTHDSFLTASGHRELREFLLRNCSIFNIHLCPTDLFIEQRADVRTCLIILRKGRILHESVIVSNRQRTKQEFRDSLLRRKFVGVQFDSLTLSGRKDASEFVIGVPDNLLCLFGEERISDLYPCITGVSTGNDKKYTRQTQVDGFSVPFYKNPASRQFYSAPDAFICDDWEVVASQVSNFMVRNRDVILRGGLSCSSMGVKFGATIRPENTLFGVNPNIVVDGDDKWWMLSYLNCRLCLYLTRAVLIRSNMITSGYASRIPVPSFDDNTKKSLSRLGKIAYGQAKDGVSIEGIIAEINLVTERAAGIQAASKEILAAFEKDPVRLC